MSTDFKIMTHVEIADMWEKREEIFKSNEVDLSGNLEIDSSGVAFLLQWAKTQNNKLTIYNASYNLKSLIKTFRLDPLFELKEK